VKRIDYRLSWTERNAGFALPTTLAPALRAPLAVLACSLALAAALWGVQHARIGALEHDGAEYERRLAAAQSGLVRVRAVERDVVRLRALDARVAEIRRSGALRASEIAALGNRLERDVWLTSLRTDRATLALEGRSARLAAVGTTIANLSQLPPYAGARLVTVHDDPSGAGVTYSITLDAKR
jgi:Tfp pilus assembly protein PilN